MRQQRRNLVSSAGGLDPGNLDHLELRLSGATLSGAPDDPVPTWTDTSGNGRHATGGPNLPALSGDSPGNPNSPTGRLGVWFNSFFNVYMTGSLPPGGLEPSRGFTAYAWFHGGGTNAAHPQVLFAPVTSGAGLVYADAGAKIGWTDQLGAHVSSASRATGYHTLVWVFYPAMGVNPALIYHQGVSVLSDSWGYTGATGPKTGYTLSNNTPTTEPFEGIFYEFDLFSEAHNLATIGQVLAWGTAFWGF